MPNVAVYDMDGKSVGEITLSETVFGAKVNESALHSCVVAYLANQRQGTQSAKTRAEVSGGGIKPWRQKGTGRARQGSTRSPQWRHGGVVFAPKPRDYRIKLNKKLKRVGMISALSSRAAQIVVVDNISLDEIKTQKMVAMLKSLNVTGKALIVTGDVNKNVYLSSRNIKGVMPSYVGMLNVYDVLNHPVLVMSKDAVQKLEEALG